MSGQRGAIRRKANKVVYVANAEPDIVEIDEPPKKKMKKVKAFKLYGVSFPVIGAMRQEQMPPPPSGLHHPLNPSPSSSLTQPPDEASQVPPPTSGDHCQTSSRKRTLSTVTNVEQHPPTSALYPTQGQQVLTGSVLVHGPKLELNIPSSLVNLRNALEDIEHQGKVLTIQVRALRIQVDVIVQALQCAQQ
ncbi:hypothetical protein CONPUDRAFT_89172 [Coniophora puteana RWD-64-598 SS2]|uniref:Uncharacterized protein n=1 Tax=Coniophora puteana (strain RWD-64-598) TaxID=741705 RepID=A0A5M3MVM3_CONPW|nr:uncharacterized protein CONPUDRAFT_89172 [Coniophora puteana RWD-64-598 SS2]EIW83212.1 hypothetical protein CONPUDRAFT_89172 [Coniophora puteana RWD-64-598 SS2]